MYTGHHSFINASVCPHKMGCLGYYVAWGSIDYMHCSTCGILSAAVSLIERRWVVQILMSELEQISTLTKQSKWNTFTTGSAFVLHALPLTWIERRGKIFCASVTEPFLLNPPPRAPGLLWRGRTPRGGVCIRPASTLLDYDWLGDESSAAVGGLWVTSTCYPGETDYGT